MKKITLLFLAICATYSVFAQSDNNTENKFKDKNIIHVGYAAQINPNFEDDYLFSGYSGLSLGLEHAVGEHWSYALNVASTSGPTYDNDFNLLPTFRTRMTLVGPEFRFYTLPHQCGLYLGLGANYIQQRVLVNRLDLTNNDLSIIQSGFAVNALIGFQSQISKSLYARFNTGLGVMGIGQSENGALNVPFNLGIGYRF